jgi:hypothetical protein
MRVRLVVRREASAEVEQASEWYEQRLTGLGEKFLEEFGAALMAVQQSPASYPVYRGEIRRVRLQKFPYGVFFEVFGSRLVVLGVFHLARNPRLLGGMLRKRK